MTDTLTLSADVIAAIDRNAELTPTTRQQYIKAIRRYLATGRDLADTDALVEYATELPMSGRRLLKSALTHWTKQLKHSAKTSATPDNVDAVTAIIYRADALDETIKVADHQGQKAHSWLTMEEVKRLIDSCNLRTIGGKRDRIVLGLLVGAGLRRRELAELTFDDIKQQPVKSRKRTVLDVKGKGDKSRVVPINDKLAAAIADWQQLTGPGSIGRALTRGGAIRDSISPVGLFHIVNRAGQRIGKPDLAPHDLRRTYAQLGYEAGVSLAQISKLLGHSSIATTQRYLNLDLDLETTVSDFIPF